jgi:hypothetical protein
MNKASSAFLATAGVTVGLLGFALPAGASVATGPTTTGTQQAPFKTAQAGGNNNKGDSNGSNGKGDDRGKNGGDTKNRGDKNPCPTRTKNPCPPKPCEVVVTKPCKPYKDKYGHLQTHTTAKHVYVCHPKPCPTKAKPCPPKCKKTQSHRHAPGNTKQQVKVG